MTEIDPTQPTPDQTDPAVKPEILETIEAATGLVWADFKRRHPSQAEGILSHLGGRDIVPEIIAVLEKGESYKELVAATAAETDVAGVIQGLAPIVLDGIRIIMAG